MKQLFFEAIERWYIILITLVISLVITFVYTKFYITPLYSSTAKVMIFNKQNVSDGMSANDLELSASTYLTRDFAEVINDKYVLSEVAKELDDKYNYSQLKSFITINNPTSTRVIEITASTPDPEDSQKIVSTICNVAQEKIVELMGLDRIQPYNYGDIPKTPSSPDMARNLMTGGILGIIVSLAAIIILYITDNKVSTVQDVEKYIGLSVLATIPYNNKQRYGKTKRPSYK